MDGFDSYAVWLEVPVDRRPPNYYELLGLETGESDAARIRAASVERSARVRRYCLGPHGVEATRLLGELGAAFACLSDPETKAAYDRELQGHAAGGSLADVSLPPIQNHTETPDEEIPPRRFAVGESRATAGGRFSSWSRRRRQVLASGPARFTFAAALLLASTCGVVWYTRRPPAEALLAGTYVRKSSLTPATVATTTEHHPPVEEKHPAVPKTPTDAATPSQSIPVIGTEPTDEDASNDDTQSVAPAGGGNDVDDGAEANPLLTGPATFGARKQPTIEQNMGQSSDPVSSPPSTAAEQGDNARDLFPISPPEVWTLSTDREPELLEVTFEPAVDAAHLELAEPSAPVAIEQVIIESDNGSTAEITPVSRFLHDGIRRWSLGSGRRLPTTRLWIRFRSATDGFVDLGGVWALDHKGMLQIPTLVRAIRKLSKGAKETRVHTNEAPTTKEKDGDVSEKTDRVDAFEIFARGALELARRKEPRSVGDYVKFFNDRSYLTTEAAIEAVSDLEQFIQDAPNSANAKSALGVLRRLARTQSKTPLGAAASSALSSSNYKSPER